MTATAEVLSELVREGISFSARNGNVILGASPDNMPDGLVARLRSVKSDLLRLTALLGHVAFIDFETRSPVSLPIVGARNYIAHPEFEALCLVAVLPDGRIIRWLSGERPPNGLFEAVRNRLRLVAHNAHGFDRLVWESLGWPKPIEWIDTTDIARSLGLSARAKIMEPSKAIWAANQALVVAQ